MSADLLWNRRCEGKVAKFSLLVSIYGVNNHIKPKGQFETLQKSIKLGGKICEKCMWSLQPLAAGWQLVPFRTRRYAELQQILVIAYLVYNITNIVKRRYHRWVDCGCHVVIFDRCTHNPFRLVASDSMVTTQFRLIIKFVRGLVGGA